MSTKVRVLEILTGYEASRINFSFSTGETTVLIARHIFERVARAIRRDHLRVNTSHVIPAGTGALYYPATGAIETPPVIKRTDEGYVLRECALAYFDLAANLSVGITHSQAAALVVSALHRRMVGLERPDWIAPQHIAADKVADELMQHYERGNAAVPAVDEASWAKLLSALRIGRPAYSVANTRTAAAVAATM